MNLIWMCLAILAASQVPASNVRQALDSCSPKEFLCSDGGCVSADLVCDGVTHCSNGDDEFGCDRGLIILSSDHSVSSRTRRQTSTLSRLQNGTCTLPEYPAHGTYVTNIPNVKPGEAYDQVNISISCRYGFVADASTSVTCFNGLWQNEMPKCVLCGTVTSSGKPLIAGGGTSAKRGDVPWHAGIYMKDTNPYRQICGGSLISTDIVLSAAHCFWDPKLLDDAKQPAASYAVAVGKLYRLWNDSTDTEAQTSDVKELHLPAHFQGNEARFQHDIAVLILTKPFVYKTFIRPVCVDFDIHVEDRQLQPGNKGMVAGWGLTSEDGTRAQGLKVMELPFVSIDTCISKSPLSFRGYITGDKMCAGFKDEGKAVCEGDSGGGLAFPASDNDTTRFFLRGIVSTAPSSANVGSFCNVDEYTTFTQIRSHQNFINKFWVTAGIWSDGDGGEMQQKKDCTLPPYPAHGTYAVANAPDAKPGDSLDFAIVNVACDTGYDVNGSRSGQCFNGVWRGQFPKCVVLPCKEQTVGDNDNTPEYSMDDVSLKHYGTMKRNSTGRLTFFELRVAIQTDGEVGIGLMEKDYSSGVHCTLYVGRNSNQRTGLDCNGVTIQDIATPGIFSSSEFRAFYIKIDDGKLQFGKEGDPPLISYSDASLGSLNNYSFGTSGGSAKIRYCPAADEGSS